MMLKVISPGAQAFSEQACSLIKVSSRGLIGEDRTLFEKRAGAQFAHEFAKLAKDLPADEPLIHLLAMGATEDYGANRNGDGFKRAACRGYHSTFVKHAHFFRDHKNKDPLKSYGRVKLSAFHEPMKRVELVVALNGSEDAAKRHNALFADRELEKLAQGREIPVSMACRVPYDVCSYCGNQAPTREQYCSGTDEGGLCKAGGLKNRMGSLIDIDGGIHQLHADNTHPAFFDISHVFRPADRIAYVSGLMKAASDRLISGSELAEAIGLTLPYTMLIDGSLPSNVQRMLKLAYELSDYEASLANGEELVAPDQLAAAFVPSVQVVDVRPPAHYRAKFAQSLRALADARIALPLSKFIELTAGYTAEKAASAAEVVQGELPGIYSRLLSRGDFAERVAASPYTPAPTAPPAFRMWADKQAVSLSLKESFVRRRVTQAAIRHEDGITVHRQAEKRAADGGPAARMAEEYALYKLAFLGAIPESDTELPLTASLALLQNYA